MFFSYVPKYGDLDYLFEKYIKNDHKTRLNFFFDVKNGIYNNDPNLKPDNKLEHSVEFISSVINVIQYIKNRYTTFFNIKDRLRFFFFCETGDSSYHKGIDMSYKSNRSINDFLVRIEQDELFSQIIFFSEQVLNDIINLLPDSYFFFGQYQEFDYIPYVVCKEKFEDYDVGVIFSNDKDMYQVNSYMHCFEQLEKLTTHSKWHPGRLFVNKDNFKERLVYKDIHEKYELTEKDLLFMQNHFSFIRAVIGDFGDSIPGIKGFGYLTFFQVLNKFDLETLMLPRSYYNEVISKMDFFKFDFKRTNVIFDLEKIKLKEKEIKNSKKLANILSTDSIKRISQNLALMDYDIMFKRKYAKEKDKINNILNKTTYFKTQEEANQFINKTGLWDKHSHFKVVIEI